VRLFIAEKPNMGRAIADCLPGSKDDRKTHVRVGNDVVTWCVGHILEMLPPEGYNPEWKAWRMEDLPIFPEKVMMRPQPDFKAQLGVIKKLLNEADEVVHAGDPGREGQMIVDEVLEYLHYRGPVKRLLLNATDPATIKKQLQKLEDNRKFRTLYAAAKCRAEADWLVGMNLSRAATKSIADAQTLVSIGRVQTPTLALVVNRCKAIENFVPRTFYDIEARVETKGGTLLVMKHAPGTEEGRLWDKYKAQELAKEAVGKVGVLKVTTTRKKVAPPKLHTLASLQNEGGKKYRWSAAKTLEMAQELYVMGCITYPRTDCHYLPEEQKDEIPQVMDALRNAPDADIERIAKAITDPMPRSAVFSAKGMEGEEHHAIIPTGKPLPQGITGPQRDLYRLVAMRYLLSLCPDYEHDETVAELALPPLVFKAKGSIPRVMGWRAYSGDKPTETVLPPMQDGEKARVHATRLAEGKTTPPSYYMEGSLVDEEMGSIAKYVEDPRIKAVLKETSGIGTSATRAAIIETLKKRGYIYVDEKGFVRDTPAGRALIEALPDRLTKPDMTAKWEMDLKQVVQGSMTADSFMEGIRLFVQGGVRWFAARQGQTMITGGNKAPTPLGKPPMSKTGGQKRRGKPRSGGQMKQGSA
jgi:DNA topoisomerase-3